MEEMNMNINNVEKYGNNYANNFKPDVVGKLALAELENDTGLSEGEFQNLQQYIETSQNGLVSEEQLAEVWSILQQHLSADQMNTIKDIACEMQPKSALKGDEKMHYASKVADKAYALSGAEPDFSEFMNMDTKGLLQILDGSHNVYFIMMVYTIYLHDCELTANNNIMKEQLILKDRAKFLDRINSLCTQLKEQMARLNDDGKPKFASIKDLFTAAFKSNPKDTEAYNALHPYEKEFKEANSDWDPANINEAMIVKTLNGLITAAKSDLDLISGSGDSINLISEDDITDSVTKEQIQNALNGFSQAFKSGTDAANAMDAKYSTQISMYQESIKFLLDLLNKNTNNYASVLQNIAR